MVASRRQSLLLLHISPAVSVVLFAGFQTGCSLVVYSVRRKKRLANPFNSGCVPSIIHLIRWHFLLRHSRPSYFKADTLRNVLVSICILNNFCLKNLLLNQEY